MTNCTQLFIAIMNAICTADKIVMQYLPLGDMKSFLSVSLTCTRFCQIIKFFCY